MPTGKIVKWVPDRGYGFVLPDDAGPTIFVHIRNCNTTAGALDVGQKVTYDEACNPRSGKQHAENVDLI
jgi:CspA family cold shock protein